MDTARSANERTAAAITADVVRDGDRFVDGAQRIVGAMPNFTMPQVDITKTGMPPLVSRLLPASAQRVRDFVAATPALRSSIDHVSGIVFVAVVMLEGPKARGGYRRRYDCPARTGRQQANF